MFIYLFQNSCIRPLALSCKRLCFISGMNVINDLCICVLHLKLWMLALIQGLALQSQGSFPLQRRDLTTKEACEVAKGAVIGLDHLLAHHGIVDGNKLPGCATKN